MPSDDAIAVDVVNVTVAEAEPDATAVVMLSAVAAAVTQPTQGVEIKAGIVSTDVSILIPVVPSLTAVIALVAFKFNPVHVMEILELALISNCAVTTKDVADRNAKVELPPGKPQEALGDSVLTTLAGNVIVTLLPIAKPDDVLNISEAVPPGPTAVDMTMPVSVVLKQPMHGEESRLTSNGTSFSKVLTSAKLLML
jgi:hypothetical protein